MFWFGITLALVGLIAACRFVPYGGDSLGNRQPGLVMSAAGIAMVAGLILIAMTKVT